MLTYAISLKRAKERNQYIQSHLKELKLEHKIIDAVDGRQLTDEYIQSVCNMEEVNRVRYWLTNGAIGCALSHKKAYDEFLSTSSKIAFIVEDDAVLPKNIKEIQKEVESILQPFEVISLYYTSFNPALISKVGGIKIVSGGGLYYPMNLEQTICATAYFIGREAAKNLSDNIIPICVAADAWYHFYNNGYIKSFRVHFPMQVSTKNFKSSIDYIKEGTLRFRIANFIDKYKIPILSNILSYRRKKFLSKMLGHFRLTDEKSPIYNNLT